MKTHTVFISVGSNMGDRLRNCHEGVDRMAGDGHVSVLTRSGIYQTEPVDYADQNWFINYVVKGETVLDPFDLLEALQTIQRDAGRKKDPVRFGPRILDMDIIFYNDFVIDSEKLRIPHPRMHKRRFVLRPVCDIDPSIIHPVFKKDVQFLLDQLNTDDTQEMIKINE